MLHTDFFFVVSQNIMLFKDSFAFLAALPNCILKYLLQSLPIFPSSWNPLFDDIVTLAYSDTATQRSLVILFNGMSILIIATES